MALWPTTAKGLKARISSYRRTLRQEYETFGMWGDGYGKRLWLFHLYFLLRDDDEVRTYIDWYVATFPDDIYEVSQCVCWALILHRLGRDDEAVYRLARGIRENLPAVAKVVGDYRGPYGIWGEEVMGLSDVDSQIIEAMTNEERHWLVATWRSPTIRDMRERFVVLGRNVATMPVGPQRSAMLDEQWGLARKLCPAEMPALSAGGHDAWLMVGKRATRATRGGAVIRTPPELWQRPGGDHR